MFYCREKELSDMYRRYEADRFECLVIYGRRRVGKTALINEFCKDKKTIYFSAVNGTADDNLAAISRAVFAFMGNEEFNAPLYNDFDTVLQQITALANKEKLIFVIDEYPYLAKAYPVFSSKLQHIIDLKWKDLNMFVILCGSSMSFMVNQVMGYESPLYGRRTGQYKIEPLNFKETACFAPNLSFEDKALLYGVTGGVPYYIKALDVNTDIHEALVNRFFDTSAYLFEEPENLLKQEMREPAIYNSVISAIAGGASRLNEISGKVGIESGMCVNYLKALIEIGLVKKDTPFTEKPGKRSVYRLEDNLFRFWYTFVPKNISTIGFNRFPVVYDKAVKPYLHDYMGLVFEKMCKDYIGRYADLPYIILDMGQWWGTDNKTHKQVQIDIVAKILNPDLDEYLLGSCKFKNEKIGIDELILLEKYAEAFGKGKKYNFIIFSKAGFTQGLIDAAAEGRVILKTLADLY